MARNEKRRMFILITPVCVANNFIKRGKAEDIEITPLKLQKLIYFLFAEYLRRTDDTLFTERFETWTLGPVVPSVYAEFSSYGKKPIETFASDSQGNSYIVTEIGVFKQCIDKIWCQYKDFSGEQLSHLTHRPGTAWSIAKEKQSRYLDLGDIKNEQEQFA